MGWGALAAGIGASSSLGGSIMSGIWSGKAARQQRKWQERMTRHAYRYTMEDMRAAGLNPILAYKQGPVTAGGGAMAHVPDLGDAITGGLSAGASAAESAGRLKKQKPETELLQASALAQTEAAKTQQTQQALNLQSQRESSARQVHTETQNALAAATLPHANIIRDFYNTPKGRTLAITKENAVPLGSLTGSALNQLSGAIDGVKDNAAKAARETGKSIYDFLFNQGVLGLGNTRIPSGR